jgi:autotransporter adhesin
LTQTNGGGGNNAVNAGTVKASDCTVANGVDTTATGLCAQAGTATAPATGASAYGSNASATANNTTAIGFRALANAAGATAVGNNAQATNTGAVAIGQNAQATGANSVALGANSIANQANTVSVGSAGNERRITNVAAGVNPTDAVNVAQLYQSHQNLYNQINNVSRLAYTGVAMSMAMSANYMPSLEPGEKSLGLGAGTYQGYGAFAVNYRQLSKGGNTSWGFAISTDGQTYGANIGVGYKWK